MPRGIALIHDPVLNKGTAFSEAERDALGLRGLLPPRVLTMEDQLHRIRLNFDGKPNAIERYIFLTALQDRNETLFYRFVQDHLEEMLPIIYTPTVGDACRSFGTIFRRSRGLYLSIRDRDRVREVLGNWPTRDVCVIVVTDGERILGLGDLGAYGMGIPIGKLALYTACGGVPPTRCLPVLLDVGTDSEDLLNDPFYTGIYQRRVRGEVYDGLIEEFVEAVAELYPGALLQWEDCATENAIRILERYRDRLPTFNDDIQGTAAVALAALLSAARIAGVPLAEQRIVFLGAGASATGVAGLIVSSMERGGLAPEEARRRVWLVDSRGLVVASRPGLASHKLPFAHDHPPVPDLAGAVAALRPTALVGLSTQRGAFTGEVLTAMARLNRRPIVFALSNPTSRAECTADEAYRHTEGRALFASGSPSNPVLIEGRELRPSQANNAFIFPGLGLGVVLAGARRVTDGMFHAAAAALAGMAETAAGEDGLLPPIAAIRRVSVGIAAAVARAAVREGLATVELPEDLESWVASKMYQPVYQHSW